MRVGAWGQLNVVAVIAGLILAFSLPAISTPSAAVTFYEVGYDYPSTPTSAKRFGCKAQLYVRSASSVYVSSGSWVQEYVEMVFLDSSGTNWAYWLVVGWCKGQMDFGLDGKQNTGGAIKYYWHFSGQNPEGGSDIVHGGFFSTTPTTGWHTFEVSYGGGAGGVWFWYYVYIDGVWKSLPYGKFQQATGKPEVKAQCGSTSDGMAGCQAQQLMFYYRYSRFYAWYSWDAHIKDNAYPFYVIEYGHTAFSTAKY